MPIDPNHNKPDKTGAMIVGLWGAVVCGASSDYTRKQFHKILDVVIAEFEAKYPGELKTK